MADGLGLDPRQRHEPHKLIYLANKLVSYEEVEILFLFLFTASWDSKKGFACEMSVLFMKKVWVYSPYTSMIGGEK